VSARRALIAALLATAVLGVLALDVLLDRAVGSFALLLLCSSPALAELLVLLKKGGSHVYLRAGLFVGVGALVARGALELFVTGVSPETRLALVVVPLAAVGLALVVIDRKRFGPTVMAVGWVPGALLFLFELRLLAVPVAHVAGSWSLPLGLALLVLVVLSVKGGDSAAYFVGRTVGKIRLAPKISPRKTWEGAIGGFVVGTALPPLVGSALGFPPEFGPLPLAILGAAANIAGQWGDLAESWAKRRADVKDSGVYLGELGGALDILDAVLAAGPVGYFVARLLAAG
jgi:phosphatidate cytidylyltransferase